MRRFASLGISSLVAYATLRAPPVMCRAGCGNLCTPSGFGLTAEQDDGRARVSLPVVALSGWVLSLISWKHILGCDPAVAVAT